MRLQPGLRLVIQSLLHADLVPQRSSRSDMFWKVVLEHLGRQPLREEPWWLQEDHMHAGSTEANTERQTLDACKCDWLI